MWETVTTLAAQGMNCFFDIDTSGPTILPRMALL